MAYKVVMQYSDRTEEEDDEVFETEHDSDGLYVYEEFDGPHHC